ncbi:MAG TPA: DUF6582 domain-containing protein [Stellaceae bacterium]
MRFYWPIAKLDAERRMVWGYASTEAADSDGERVRREALSAALDDYMRFANIREMHRPSAVGVAEEAAIDDKGLYLGARIVDGEAWEKVVAGVYKGFSIGGRVTARDPADRNIITGLSLTEISVVDRPANPEAVFDCWKRAAAVSEAIEYADPGYQEDGEQRYPIDTAAHIRAAWAYIHMPENAARYTAARLAHIEARIAAAWRERIDPAGPPAASKRIAADTLPYPPPLAGEGRVGASPPVSSHPAVDSLPQRLRAALGELCEVLDAFGDVDNSYKRVMAGLDPAISEIRGSPPERPARAGRPGARMTLSGGGGKLTEDVLAKFAGEVLPRLDALQQRMEQIARTPLPPQTVARGFASLSKREDAGFPSAASDDIVAALARMSQEERTLLLIKAAHANPIRPSR